MRKIYTLTLLLIWSSLSFGQCDPPADIHNFYASNNSLNVYIAVPPPNGNGFEAEIVPTGTIPNGTGIQYSTSTFLIENLQSSTAYDVYIRSICDSGISEWVGPYTYSTLSNCGNNFYDSGGSNGNYYEDEYYESTFFPNNPGDRVKAVINTFDVPIIQDTSIPYQATFSVYNGPDSTYPLIYRNLDNMLLPTFFESTEPTTGALTIVFNGGDGDAFTSDPLTNQSSFSGFDLSIICEPIPSDCDFNPTDITVLTTTANSLTFDWTENSNASEWEIEVVPENSTPQGTGIVTTEKPYTFTGLNIDTRYDIYIRSICTNNESGWSFPSTFPTFSSSVTNYCGTTFTHNDVNFSNGDFIMTIYPEQSGDRITIFSGYTFFPAFSWGASQIKVYNGPNISYPILGVIDDDCCSSNSTLSFSSTEPVTGALTLQYTKRNTYSGHGGGDWNLDIFCEPMPDFAGRPANIQTSSITGNAATLEWTDPDYSEWEVSVVPLSYIWSMNPPVWPGIITSENPFDITGLSIDTPYVIYLRGVSGNQRTDWTYINFETEDQLSVDEFLKEKIKLYPNPIVDFLHINSEIPIERVAILDISGRLVSSFDKVSRQEKLDMNSLKTGVYFLKIQSEQGNFMKKIIKN